MIQRKLHSKDAPRARGSNDSDGERKRKPAGLPLAPGFDFAAAELALGLRNEPVTIGQKPAVQAEPQEDAAALARQFRLELMEVKYAIRAFERAAKRSPKGLRLEDMHEVLKSVFDVPKVEAEIVEQAFKHTCEPGSPTRAGMPPLSVVQRFLSWYQVNMFKSVADLNVSKQDQMAYDLAKQHGCSAIVVDKVKKKFDAYDSDGSGKIDYDEFMGMLVQLLHAKTKEDISEDRVTRFWREIDDDGSGEVDFSEFLGWYLKYFDPELLDSGMSSGPMSQFYASFNPTLVRHQNAEHV